MRRKYTFELEGDKPLPLLKKYMEELKTTNPGHVLLKAKGFELVAVPVGQNASAFISNFLDSTAKPDTVYIAVKKMGEVKNIFVDEIQMTGKCKVNDNVVKGARKWETLHVVYVSGSGREVKTFDGKTEAMAFAKQYAMDNDTDVFVELEKRLVGSSSRVADISPIKKHVKENRQVTVNQFLFFGKGE